MKIQLITLILFLPFIVCAQVGMGQWQTHFSYNEMTNIEEAPTIVYGISDGALFGIHKEDNEIETFSKINGQHDFSVSLIRYNSSINALLIAYENGNLDVLYEDGIKNIADIKEKNISASKNANDMLFVNDLAYISCGIGIVVVNLNKLEIKDSYIIGNNSTSVEIKSVAFMGDSIYALSAEGLYAANKNNTMLADYNNWNYRTNLLLSSNENKKMLCFNNRLYVLKANGEVYVSEDAMNWSLFHVGANYRSMRFSDNNLLLLTGSSLLKFNEQLELETLSNLKAVDAVYNATNNTYWVASSDSTGILKIQSGAVVQQFKPDGPATNKIINVKYDNDRLFALTGAPWDNDIYDQNRPGAVMILENNSWINITNKDVKPFTDRNFEGVTYVAADKSDNKHFFISTYRNGLYEFKNDAFFKRYNHLNSTIENFHGNDVLDDYLNVDGVCFDNNNNLWMNNTGTSPSRIKVLLTTGNWIKLDYFSGMVEAFDKIIIAQNNYKWMNLPKDGGVFILNDKNDPLSRSTHQYRFFKSVTDQDENDLKIDRVYSLAEDLDNNIWIGTLNGPVIFKNTEQVFNTDYTVYRPKIARNDGSIYADYLLEGERINAIAVDGANRKWIGTAGSGAYLMSDDGLETIQHFTTDNSPILSNAILSITINNKTGEVFFATDKGLISYMSDAAQAEKNYASIAVYPNPVRESFNGIITISGLMEDTTVKITDASGNIVYQTKSNGGIATWNGFTNRGIKASSGVYFVMGANATDKNSENVQTAIGKILIIR